MEKKYQTPRHDEANKSIFRQLFEIQYELEKHRPYVYQQEMRAIVVAIDQLFEKVIATLKDE